MIHFTLNLRVFFKKKVYEYLKYVIVLILAER